MPQIANTSAEECTCKDEVKVYNEEGEEEDEKKRSSENLSIDKVDLVTEGEDQKRLSISDLFRPSYDSVFGVPLADYFFPPYAGSYASAFSQDTFGSKVPFMPPNPGTFGFMPFAMRDAIGSCGLNGALGFPSAYPFPHRNGFMFENLASMWANSASNQSSFPPLLNPFMSPPSCVPPTSQSATQDPPSTSSSSSSTNLTSSTSSSSISQPASCTASSSLSTSSLLSPPPPSAQPQASSNSNNPSFLHHHHNHNHHKTPKPDSFSATKTGRSKDSTISSNNNGSGGSMFVPSPLRPTPINLSTYSSISTLKCSSESKESNTNHNSNSNNHDKRSGDLPANPVYSNGSSSNGAAVFNLLSSLESASPTMSTGGTKSANTANNSNNSNNTGQTTQQQQQQTNKAHSCSDSEHSKSDLIDSRYCKSNHHKDSQRPHIKKPLNAFMLFMKEMRQQVQEECTLKESAAINQILGKKWHTLSKEQQSKYYEIARKEKQLHIQLFPEWSARDNYAIHSKHKKRRRMGQGGCTDGSDSKMNDANNMKKCRARYGIEQMSQWCKPCRRKKKCIRFLKTDEGSEEGGSKPAQTQTQRLLRAVSDEEDMSDRAPSPQGPFLSSDDCEMPPSVQPALPPQQEPPFRPQLEPPPATVTTTPTTTSSLIPSPSSAFSSLKSSVSFNTISLCSNTGSNSGGSTDKPSCKSEPSLMSPHLTVLSL